MSESQTPITDRHEFNESCNYEVVWPEEMRALELAANGLRERLAARQWVQYVDAEGEVWAACSDCLQSPEEGHAPNCETALALSAFATLTKQPAEPSK